MRHSVIAEGNAQAKSYSLDVCDHAKENSDNYAKAKLASSAQPLVCFCLENESQENVLERLGMGAPQQPGTKSAIKP